MQFSECYQHSEIDDNGIRVVSPLPFTSVNASVITIIIMFCIYIAPFIRRRSSEKLYKYYLIKPSQPPCETGKDKRDYP